MVLLPSIGQEATAWRVAPLDLFGKNCYDLFRIGLLMTRSAALVFNRRQRIFQVQNKKLFIVYGNLRGPPAISCPEIPPRTAFDHIHFQIPLAAHLLLSACNLLW